MINTHRARRRLRDPFLAAKLDACDREQAEFDEKKKETSDRIASITAVIDAASSGVITIEIDPEEDNSMVHAVEGLGSAQRR